jgi:hypothetical protein
LAVDGESGRSASVLQCGRSMKWPSPEPATYGMQNNSYYRRLAFVWRLKDAQATIRMANTIEGTGLPAGLQPIECAGRSLAGVPKARWMFARCAVQDG